MTYPPPEHTGQAPTLKPSVTGDAPDIEVWPKVLPTGGPLEAFPERPFKVVGSGAPVGKPGAQVNVRPCGRLVLLETTAKSPGKLYVHVPDGSIKPSKTWLVLAVGPGEHIAGGQFVQPPFEPGELVVLAKGVDPHRPDIFPDDVGLVHDYEIWARIEKLEEARTDG